ncbi:hypothetical protein AQV86_05350 [Nanohaloarchaea archaeon SG9]|nr:hypothetical protein AQV86_05350 [Nanohaloarchaea archaeon SG9]
MTRDADMLRQKASDFFDIVTEADSEEVDYAGEMVRRAFWLADEGEKYQDENRDLENHFYDSAENFLREAFETVGLDGDIARHRRDWWQGYRHGEIRDSSIEKDLEEILGEKYEPRDLNNFKKAAYAHDENNWEKAFELLEPVYQKVV